MKRAEKIIVPIVFMGVLYQVHT